jgi:uncharacterized membrane protein YcjF (UPF0283 family)
MHATPGEPVRVPAPPAHLDARSRAVRTFIGSLAAAVVAAVIPVALALAGQIQWTREWWIAAATSVGLAALNAAVAYVARHWFPPQV